jgi:hypothetical protein
MVGLRDIILIRQRVYSDICLDLRHHWRSQDVLIVPSVKTIRLRRGRGRGRQESERKSEWRQQVSAIRANVLMPQILPVYVRRLKRRSAEYTSSRSAIHHYPTIVTKQTKRWLQFIIQMNVRSSQITDSNSASQFVAGHLIIQSASLQCLTFRHITHQIYAFIFLPCHDVAVPSCEKVWV